MDRRRFRPGVRRPGLWLAAGLLAAACGSVTSSSSTAAPTFSPPGTAVTPSASTPRPSYPAPPPGSSATATVQLPDARPATLEGTTVLEGCHAGGGVVAETFQGSSGGQTLTVTVHTTRGDVTEAIPAENVANPNVLPSVHVEDTAGDRWLAQSGTVTVSGGGRKGSVTAMLAQPGQPATLSLAASWACGT
jgi:hypothetical protein